MACILFDGSDGVPADWWKRYPLHTHYSEARRILLVLTLARSLLAILAARHQVTEMYCVSRNSISPSWAPSRPRPDCFVPPNGAAGSETRPRFNPIMP